MNIEVFIKSLSRSFDKNDQVSLGGMIRISNGLLVVMPDTGQPKLYDLKSWYDC